MLSFYLKLKCLLLNISLSIGFLFISSNLFSQTSDVFNASGSWVCPAGVFSIKVESWGGGGAGGGVSGSNAKSGGGGGGGAYTIVNSVAVSPGTTYNITVGLGNTGSTGNGADGGNTFFNASTALANGGSGGGANDGAGGAGGTGTFKGGNGYNGSGSNPGGGGGSGGTSSNGNSATNRNGASAVTGGGAGGDGPSSANDGSDGNSPGGGGGGARKTKNGGNKSGGNGADGKLIISYTALTYKSQIISMSYGSSTWCAGAKRTVTVVIKNIGTATWTDASPDINIGLKWNADGDYGGAPSYITRQNAGNLAPGATGTYTFTNVQPPSGATTENLTADVVYEALSWFANNNYGVGPGNVVFTSPVINVSTTPTITSQPISTQNSCVGNAISISVVATGGSLSYQWRKGVTPLTDGGAISGSSTATLNISSVAAGDAASNYNVIVTNSCGSATSNNSILIVNSLPSAPANPTSNSPQCNSVTLTRAGTPPGSINWYWQTIAGGNSTANSSSTYSVASSGTYYIRAQDNTTGCWSTSSGSATVIVNSVPSSPSVISGPGAVCSGSSQNYSVTNVAGITYTWSVPAGWSISTGQGTNAITYVTGASGGTISVTPSNGCGSGTSSTLAVVVDQTLYWAGLGTTITGGTTGTDFNTAANWSTNNTTFVAAGAYPGACNDVVINMALSTTSTATILFSQPATTIKSLNFSLNGSTTKSTIYEAGLRLDNQSLTILGTTTLYAQNNTVNRTTQVTLDAINAGSLFTFNGDIFTNATNPGGGTGECIVYPFSNPVGTTNMGKFVVKGNCTFEGVGDDAHPQLNKPTTLVFDGTGTQTITNNNSNGYPIFLGFTTKIGETNSPNVILTGSNALGFQTINDLIINNNATLDISSGQSLNRIVAGTPGTFTMNAGSKLLVRGNSGGAPGSNFPTNFSTAYSLNASSTVEYASANGVNQTVFGPITYGNLVLTNSSGSGSSVKTSGGNLTFAGNVTVNGFTTFDLLSYTANRSAAGGTFSVAANSYLRLAGSSGGAGSSNFPNNFSTVSFAPLSTEEFYGTGAQSVYATTYGNLILSTGNTKTASGSLTIANDLTINTTALFNMGSYSHSLKGNWYNNVSSAATIPSTSTFILNGTGAQIIGGTAASVFYNLSINNSSGVSISQDQSVNNILNLISGNLRLTTKNLSIAGSSSVSGSPFSASKMIVVDGGGELRKTFSTTGSYFFPVGDETGTPEYSPITLNYTSGTFAGGAYSGVKLTNAKHPNNASTTDYLKRYWTISNSGITSPSLNVSGTYVTADIAGTESSIFSAKYAGALPWVKYNVLASNTLTANGITNTGSGIALTGITNQTLAVSISGGDVSICKGNSVSLSSTVTNNGTGSVTYSWSPVTGLSSSTIANPVATPTSTTTYTLTVTDGNGITATASTTITVTLTASATISYTGSPFCSSAGLKNVTQTGTSGGTYSSTAGLSINSSTGQINTSTSTPATYTVTYTVAAAGGCALFSTTTSITIQPQPAITANNSGPVCMKNIITLSASSIAGATYSWSGPGGYSSLSQNPNFVYDATKAGVYSVVATTAGGCISNTATTTVSSSLVSGLWTGAVSNDWSDANNWCNGVLPTSATDVSIPAAALNMPLISDSRDCNNITVDSGDTLTVGVGGMLNIYGSISSSNKNIKAANGSISMNGSTAQTITTQSFFNNAIKDLIINNSSVSGVSLGGPIDIYGSLTFSGTGKKLNTNDTLTLKSNINGTAWVGDLTGNTISGKVTVERYITNHKAWRLLSVPTFGIQTIKSAWQENSTGGGSDPVPGFGTQITSPSSTWLADGFDLKSSAPSMKTYDPVSDGWIGVATTNATNIANNNGYLLYVRGNRLATGTASPVTSTTLRTKGKLYSGTLPALTAIPDKYMSVGNPYASAIDFTQITLGNGIDNKFYVFDPFIAGYYGYGGFQVISAVNGWKPIPGGSPVYPTGVVNTKIQSGEAFFVHATTVPSLLPANYNVVFSEGVKIAGGDIKPGYTGAELGQGIHDEIQSLSVTLYTGASQNDVVADGNVAVFDKNYSSAIDNYDAKKIAASGENFDLKRGGVLLAIEARPALTAKDTLFYNMSKLAKTTYQLRFDAENLAPTGLTPILIDQYLNTRTSLKTEGASLVDITIDGDSRSSSANRFMVVFSPQMVLPVTFVNISAARKDSGVQVQWTIANEKNIRTYQVERATDGINFISIGKVNSQNQTHYSLIDRSAGTDVYYYRISAINADGAINKSGIAKVNSLQKDNLLSVYPNPVKNNNIQLRFGNQESAKYNVKLINEAGKIIFTKTIYHKAGIIVESIKPEMAIAHGIYQLEITRQDGNVNTIQLLF